MAGKGGKGESVRDTSKTLCRFYSRGTCWKGSDCPYLHEGNIPQGQPKGKGKVQQQATVETQPRHSGDVALAAENQRLHNRLSTQFWCTEFLKGDCQMGAGCDYLHLDPEQVGKLKAFRKKNKEEEKSKEREKSSSRRRPSQDGKGKGKGNSSQKKGA